MATATDLVSLIGLLYEAAAEPERWPEVLAAITRSLHCGIGLLQIDQGDSPAFHFHAYEGLNASAVTDLHRYYAGINPAMPPLFALARGGLWAGLGQSLISEEEFRRTEFYSDWGRPHGAFWLASIVAHEAGGITALHCSRAEQTAPMNDREERTLARLAPHFGRAMQIRSALAQARAEALAACAVLDRTARAVFALDALGQVALHTRVAEQLLLAGDGLRLRQRQLRCSQPAANQRLQMLVQGVLATSTSAGTHPGGVLRCPRLHGPDLLVKVVPFRAGRAVDQHLRTGHRVGPGPASAAIGLRPA